MINYYSYHEIKIPYEHFYIYLTNLLIIVRQTIKLINGILRGINTTIWGGVEGAEKVGTAVKTGISGADVVIGTSYALEDFACNDPICVTIDVIGSLSSSLGLILAHIPVTKNTLLIPLQFPFVAVQFFYCKNYGTYWGYTVAAVSATKNKLVK